jgi:hypothetical protein
MSLPNSSWCDNDGKNGKFLADFENQRAQTVWRRRRRRRRRRRVRGRVGRRVENRGRLREAGLEKRRQEAAARRKNLHVRPLEKTNEPMNKNNACIIAKSQQFFS